MTSWPPLGDVGYTFLGPPCSPSPCCYPCHWAAGSASKASLRGWLGRPA